MDTVTAPLQNGPHPAEASGHPGRRGRAVGHMARQTVASAMAAGVDLPKNAQGFAASLIARGADPESLFSAAVAHVTAAGQETGATQAISAYEFNAPAVSTTVLAPADAAQDMTAPF